MSKSYYEDRIAVTMVLNYFISFSLINDLSFFLSLILLIIWDLHVALHSLKGLYV